MRNMSKLSYKFNSHPPVYDLPIRPQSDARNPIAKIRKFQLGKKEIPLRSIYSGQQKKRNTITVKCVNQFDFKRRYNNMSSLPRF